MNKLPDLRLEISNYCNLKCPHCVRSWLDEMGGYNLNSKHVSLKTIKKWFPTITLEDKFNTVFLSGAVAEPTLNPECIEICKYISTSSNIMMDSNGSTNNEQWWNELGSHNISCTFSPDSLVPKNNQYRINSNTEKVISNMRAFISGGGKASWKYIPFQHNEDELEKQKKIALDLGAKFLMVQPGKFDEYDKDEKMKSSKHFPNSQDLITSLTINSTPEKYCKLLGDSSLIEVSPDGIVYLCCYMSRYFFLIYSNYFEKNDPKPTINPEFMVYERYKSFVDDIIPLIENQGGIETLSLYHNTVDEILESDLFKFSLKKSWKIKNDYCNKHCRSREYIFSETEQ